MSHLDRILADRAIDEDAWLLARRSAICASDAAKLSKLESVPLYLAAKIKDGEWSGNEYTRYGTEVEAGMLAWAGIPGSTALFHSVDERGFAATPDGIQILPNGSLILAECKTTSKPFRTIPRSYYRQVWWAQYVLGAEQTKFIWYEHTQFEGNNLDPHIKIIDRDDEQITKMLTIARPLLSALRGALAFEQEIAA